MLSDDIKAEIKAIQAELQRMKDLPGSEAEALRLRLQECADKLLVLLDKL